VYARESRDLDGALEHEDATLHKPLEGAVVCRRAGAILRLEHLGEAVRRLRPGCRRRRPRDRHRDQKAAALADEVVDLLGVPGVAEELPRQLLAATDVLGDVPMVTPQVDADLTELEQLAPAQRAQSACRARVAAAALTVREFAQPVEFALEVGPPGDCAFRSAAAVSRLRLAA
jgi:hypothetical protein